MASSAFSNEALGTINTNIKTSSTLLDNGAGSVQVGLFVNNVTPTASSTITSLGESTNSSYSRQTLSSPMFMSGFNLADQNVNVAEEVAIFDFTTPSSPPETIFGWFLTQTVASTATLIYSKTLDDPIEVQFNNQLVAITPQVSLSNSCGGN